MQSVQWKKIWVPLALLCSSLSLAWGADPDPHAARKTEFLQAAYDQNAAKLTACIEEARSLNILPELVAAIGEVNVPELNPVFFSVHSTTGNALHQLFLGDTYQRVRRQGELSACVFQDEENKWEREDVQKLYEIRLVCLNILLEADCSVNVPSRVGSTPLHLACNVPEDFLRVLATHMNKQHFPDCKIYSKIMAIIELQAKMTEASLPPC